MPECAMMGINDKVYRLSELKGHVVVLSFWVSLTKPFWSPTWAKAFADALRPHQSETDPVLLGVLQASKKSVAKVMATETLPFVPIPDSYGFHQKFHVISVPSFIVIDRLGKVAAYIDGAKYDELQKVVQAVSR